MTLRTPEITVSVAALLERPALRLREHQHATDRLFAIHWNALSSNARQPGPLAFLSGKLR